MMKVKIADSNADVGREFPFSFTSSAEELDMALVPQIVDAVDVPVIAAGGIGDSRGIAAAFALGAKGVQMGSRFVVSKECIAHENYKKLVLKAKDRSTVVTGRSTGHPVRVIGNHLTREYLELEKNGAPIEELEKLGAGKLHLATHEGDVDHEQYKKLFDKGPSRISPFFIPMMIGNMAAGQISITLGLRGPSSCVVTACATGSNCIGDAFRVIQRGDADVMVAGGTEASISQAAVAGFCSMRALENCYNSLTFI